MQTYRIPQREVQVVVHLRQGEPLSGVLFVPVDGPGGTVSRLSDRLADPTDRFLAMTERHTSRLISHDWILYVELTSEEDAEIEREHAIGETVAVSCRMADGAVLAGDVSYAMPPGRERLIDYLNSQPRGFVPLQTARSLFLVHLRHVVDWEFL